MKKLIFIISTLILSINGFADDLRKRDNCLPPKQICEDCDEAIEYKKICLRKGGVTITRYNRKNADPEKDSKILAVMNKSPIHEENLIQIEVKKTIPLGKTKIDLPSILKNKSKLSKILGENAKLTEIQNKNDTDNKSYEVEDKKALGLLKFPFKTTIKINNENSAEIKSYKYETAFIESIVKVKQVKDESGNYKLKITANSYLKGSAYEKLVSPGLLTKPIVRALLGKNLPKKFMADAIDKQIEQIKNQVIQ